MKISTDKELSLALQSGDWEAFNTLYKRYLQPLYKYIYSILGTKSETEDIIQEVFVKLWMNREHFELTGSLKGYLFKIAKNLTINHFRRQGNIDRYNEHVENVSGNEKEDSTNHRVIFNEYYRIAQDAIEQLPPGQARVFKLSTENDMSLQEIADHLGISKSGVKNQLYAAVKFIREYLKQHASITFLLSTFISLFR